MEENLIISMIISKTFEKSIILKLITPFLAIRLKL